MSWMQNLYNTYEKCADAVGVNGDNQPKMLLPLGHILKKTNVAIYLREDGTFHRAEKSDLEVCTPCTDGSESRTIDAKDWPHPLFDQIKHLGGRLYLENLLKWQNYIRNMPEYPLAYKMITSVRRYIENGTLKSDLESSKINPDNELFVRFSVNVGDQIEDRLWMIPEMWTAWYSYLMFEEVGKRGDSGLCYISGEIDKSYTEKHPKSINRFSGNAKLITANDKNNFTYRGRFEEPSQAVTISFEASQKAHQALRWLIVTQGYRCNTQAIVAWAIDKTPALPNYYDDSQGIYESMEQGDLDKRITAENVIYKDYAIQLNKAIAGYGDPGKLKKHVRRVAVLATDNATTGRMSVIYYRELTEDEYLERIAKWHSTCSWYQLYRKDKGTKDGFGYFVSAPSFDRITEAILGRKRSQKDDSYDKLKKSLRERLLHCVFDGDLVPVDMATSAVQRASNPQALEKTGAKSIAERWREWEQVLCTTCALVKRFYHDYEKEEFEVGLEEQRTDRDYLYGRLLAVADKIESLARHKQGTTKVDARATNAIRYMTAFSQHPFRTWHTLFTQHLNHYIQQLNGAYWYLNQIETIMLLFNEGECELDKPLNGKFLLGFFAQRQMLRLRQEKDKGKINGGEKDESDEKN